MNFLILLIFFVKFSQAIDVFCGQLEVFNEQRYGLGAITVSSQSTVDLKQCLDVCCQIPNCDGVTFEGITANDFNEPNCLLVSCDPICQLNPPNQKSSGILSVILHRQRNTTTTTTTTEMSLSNSTTPYEFKAALTPFWVLAIAITVAAVCIGLNLTLCLAYCCYCRRKKRSQKAQISTVKGGPTLHAYNQPI
ncbi:unnamed protein product [Caenorhabditis angaria]|uniref:Seven cysteines N-terminal domain-containing protein n=1 Tax=Caenorhabditis angaria TaxID=860376 RepID=A0A9P1MT88_9PELO|nr:unnamed protein product [Caenorhabditis angaria]